MSGPNHDKTPSSAADISGTGNNSTCPRCGGAFDCGAKAGLARCWCVALPPLAAPDLTASCYCPRCLEETLKERGG
jgi:hypothetical protein